MTAEQRLDPLERIVRLMIRAGLRARRQSREQDEKINILIDMHMKSEERIRKNEEMLAATAAKNEERFAKNDERFAHMTASYEERFRKNQEAAEERFRKNQEAAAKNEKMLAELAAKTEESFAALAAAGRETDERLRSFMQTVERIITERRDGKP